MFLIKIFFLFCSIIIANSNDLCRICGTPPAFGRVFGNGRMTIAPWAVYMEQSIAGSTHFCTGSIIDDQHIVTQAHCFLASRILSPKDKAESLQVFAGDLVKMGSNSILLNSERVELHPKFQYTDGDVNSYDDIAIIKLNKKLQFNNRIKPICLGIDALENEWTSFQGYGNKNADSESFSNRLNEANLKVRPSSDCKRTYGKMYRPEHLCAQNGTTGACSGDSGGPLLRKKNGRTYMIGITSWGGHCDGFPNKPIVFTRAKSYLKWMQNVTKSNLDCTNVKEDPKEDLLNRKNGIKGIKGIRGK